jgi:hypothetical protein
MNLMEMLDFSLTNMIIGFIIANIVFAIYINIEEF